MKRRLLLLGSLLAFSVGLLAVLMPTEFSFRFDRIVLVPFGVIVLLLALRVIQTGRRGEYETAVTPDPERTVPLPSPGDDIDSVIEAVTDRRFGFTRTRVHRGLETLAVGALTRYAGLTADEAQRRIERGNWTDNPHAASFLGGSSVPEPQRSLLDRFQESRFDRGIRETVAAIADVAGVPGASGERVDTPDDRPTTVEPGEDVTRSTGQWQGISAAALAALGVGLLATAPGALLAGVVGLGVGAYARASTTPSASLSVERHLENAHPEPGESVEVTVAVRNDGNRPLVDLRLIDGVPEALEVVEGSPRLGTALRPGEEVSFCYTVEARRGEHDFGALMVLARGLAGASERERRIVVETTLTCVPDLIATIPPVPLRNQVAAVAGPIETPAGGEGIEFHATRQYRPGDPMSRVDWNRRARTGEFATLEFREERAATIVLVIDARAVAYAAPTPEAEGGVDLSVKAAGRVFARLFGAGNRVGIAALGRPECWFPPESGRNQLRRARTLLATHPALTPVSRGPTGPRRWDYQLRRWLSPGTQAILFSSLLDDEAVSIARRLEAFGRPVTVVSPNPIADRLPGHALARVARAMRITDLRADGIRVVNWQASESLDVALANSRWSR